MDEKQETIADIIAEMRGPKFYPWGQGGFSVEMDLTPLADRLEAAWKREKTAIEADALTVGGIVEASRATTENSSAVGDAAKLREALERLREWAALDLNENTYIEQKSGNYLKLIKGVLKIANAALSAPPRNCDVGTAEEQENRLGDTAIAVVRSAGIVHFTRIDAENAGSRGRRCPTRKEATSEIYYAQPR